MKMKTLLAALSVFSVAIAALADEHAMAPSVQQLRYEWVDIAGDITQATNEATESSMHAHAMKLLARAQERINALKREWHYIFLRAAAAQDTKTEDTLMDLYPDVTLQVQLDQAAAMLEDQQARE